MAVLRTFRVLLVAWMLNILLWIPGIIMPLEGVSAEEGASLVCGEGKAACADGSLCYMVSERCNSFEDCSDGSDEMDCCQADEIYCEPDHTCLLNTYRCDGLIDCPDDSDELNCTEVLRNEVHNEEIECQQDSEFKCVLEQICIPAMQKCDGFEHCEDGSDELGCFVHLSPRRTDVAHDNSSTGVDSGSSGRCSQNEFDCKGDGSECVRNEFVCDGHVECSGGQDENSAACDMFKQSSCAVANGGCDHICLLTDHGHVCACHEGFQLNFDRLGCTDVNECDRGNRCAHFCRNSDGHHECSCKEDYHLATDGFSCLADGAEPKLIYANGIQLTSYGIRSHNKTSTTINTVVQGIAYDYKAGKIFYIDSHSKAIKWIPEDFSSPSTTLVDRHIHDPVSLAYDWIHDILYWGDVSLHSGGGPRSRVEAVQLSNMMRTTVLSSPAVRDPRQLVVDPRQGEGYLYWAQISTLPGICRSGLDGSEPVCFITTDVQQPSGLTIDYLSNTLYWIDKHQGRIVSYDLLSKQRKIVTNDIEYPHHPWSLDIFEDVLYWADDMTKSIYKWNLMSSTSDATVQKVFEDLDNTKDVAVYHSLRYPTGQSYCGTDNGGCSHICLPSPHFKRYSCACPDPTKHQTSTVTYSLDRTRKQCVEKVDAASVSTVTMPARGASTSTNVRSKAPSSAATQDPLNAEEDGDREEHTEENSGGGGGAMMYVGVGLGVVVLAAVVAVVIWRVRVSQSAVRRQQSAGQVFETKPLNPVTPNGHGQNGSVV